MYLSFCVDIPAAAGKITFRRKGETDYVYFEYARQYDRETQKTNPKRVTIGKRSAKEPDKMFPNENFLKYFPEAILPEDQNRNLRSSCLSIGDYLVLRKLLREARLPEVLGHYFSDKDLGLFLDLLAYTIVTENNAGQYYPNYAYRHPLFTKGMRIYSDSKVSDFLSKVTEEQISGFLNEWNGSRDHRQKIYISYDATNKNCQAGDIKIVEFGHPKIDAGLPIFNYAIAYDTHNQEPLFYEDYPGSLNDISQMDFMLEKAFGYGYRHIGFILDRGYFSQHNLESMDEKGYSFVIMVKGREELVKEKVKPLRGTFEKKRVNFMDEYEVYGTTVKAKLFETDKKERYLHIYHSIRKKSAECTAFEAKIRELKKFLNRHRNDARVFGKAFQDYFLLHTNPKTGQLLFAEEKTDIIEEEMELCGYFCIATSEKMTAKEAIDLYKSRDTSEKLFRSDKSYLGDKSLRVYKDEAASAKIFIEFVALIIRNRLYHGLKEKMRTMGKKMNYMTVPAALRELEKIEMVRLTDNVYHLDHAVTKTQKIILSAFGMDAGQVKAMAKEISEKLK